MADTYKFVHEVGLQRATVWKRLIVSHGIFPRKRWTLLTQKQNWAVTEDTARKWAEEIIERDARSKRTITRYYNADGKEELSGW